MSIKREAKKPTMGKNKSWLYAALFIAFIGVLIYATSTGWL